MKKIFIVEDDKTVSKELLELLTNAGYSAKTIENFEKVEEEINIYKPDLILLDINIPYINGEILLQNLRKKIDTPIIMVTSRNDETDEVLSMSYGADDYITKPYNPNILLLHIGAIFKRLDNYNDKLFYKDLEIDTSKGIVKNKTEEIMLTKNEMLIFSYLVSKKEHIVTRDELMTLLWNNNEYINDNALTVNISRLRTKLMEIGYKDIIVTRKREGYILL